MSLENENLSRYFVLQNTLQYHFKDISLLDLALTHSSWANEHANSHNERLEFLGDAVLELNISTELYKRFPQEREGTLTKFRSLLVGEKKLASIAVKLNLPKYLRIGRGEEGQGGRLRPALIADAVEALLGAVYLDGGHKAASELISFLYQNSWSDLSDEIKTKDPKTKLQELTQAALHSLPVYAFLDSEGPDHAKVFKVSLTLSDGRIFYASGKNIKNAEHSAATLALKALSAENQQIHPNKEIKDKDSDESLCHVFSSSEIAVSPDSADKENKPFQNTEVHELAQTPQCFFLGRKPQH